MNLVQTVAPTEEPVTLIEQKAHSRISSRSTSQDEWLEQTIVAARRYFEDATEIQVVTATWKLYLDEFPCGTIRFPRRPVQSVSSITYVDTDGTTQTLSASAYQVDTVGARLAPVYGGSWPSTYSQFNAICITFVAGFGAASVVPEDIKAWHLAAIEHLYQSRSIEETTVGGSSREPMIFKQMLMNHWSGNY